jgi:Tol biopolymer transport system component
VARVLLALALLAAPGPLPSPRAAAAAERGRLIAYEKTVAGNTDIYVVAAGGGVERRLTHDPADDILPRFEPGGASVLFSSRRLGHWQLFEVAATGGAPRALHLTGSDEWQADPSPDGRRIALLSNQAGPQGLYLLDRRSGRLRLLVDDGPRAVLGNPNWSPDGGRIVYSSNGGRAGHHVYVIEVASGRSERVSSLLSGACEPRFSRDGRRVAYVRRQHLTRSHSRIVERELQSGAERALVDWDGLNYDPVYSPDGSELAFASTVSGEFAVYRLRFRDGRAYRVSLGPGAARHPDYQP